MKMRYFKIIAFVLCAFFIAFNSISKAKNVPYERDEISWYFHTKFFDEAFIKKNISSPLWYGYESFDHPQISKYIYGAYLYLRDHNYSQLRDSLEAKYGRWSFYYGIKSDEEISTTEFPPMLLELRKINIVFTLFILAEIYALFYLLSRSSLFSLFITGILSINPLFVYSTAIVTSDNHFLLFGLLAVILYFLSMRDKRIIWTIASSAAVVLSTGSKLTGIFFFIAIIFHEIIQSMFAKIALRTLLKRIGIFCISCMYFWIIINPALYINPLRGTWKYFSFRNFQSANIAYHIPEAGINTLSDKANALYCTLLAHSCDGRFTDASLTKYEALNIILLVMGLYYGWKNREKNKNYFIFWIILGYINSMAYLTILSNYSERYYILPQIIVFMIQLFGVADIINSILFIFQKYRTNTFKK